MTELPLIEAARKGRIEKVRQLLESGHDVNEHGVPLSEKELKAAKLVISMADTSGAVESIGRTFDITPLMAAAENGSMEVVEALLDAGADANAADSLKRTPLMIAIEWKHEPIVRRLLEAGADPNARDLSGDPVLTQAIYARLWPLAHTLLDAGAEAQPKGKKDSQPLKVVSNYCGGGEALGLMLRLLDAGAKPSDPTVLLNVVERQDAEMVRRFLHDYPKLVERTSHDRLLELAAKRRNAEIIRALTEGGIRPEDLQKKSSALSAVIVGPARSSEDFYLPEHRNDDREIECLELLFAAGARVDPTDGERAPLHYAIMFLRSELCRWLLTRGADPNSLDDGETPLRHAGRKLKDIVLERYEDSKERTEMIRRQEELRRIIKLLENAGGKAEEIPGDTAPPDQPASEQSVPRVLATPVAQRRGLCDETFFKAEQIMIRADMDRIADVLEKDNVFERVERNVFARLGEVKHDFGDLLSLVKLKGHDWVYVSRGRRTRGDSQIKAWSKKLKAPLLLAGQESASDVVYYALYDCGRCVESFESDGQWFRGGVEIDPEVNDESDRMLGTDFTSVRRDPDGIDWSTYESEWQFLDDFLRQQDAYLTFPGVGFEKADKPFVVASYHDDEATAESIERIDLAFYKLTPAQRRYVEQQPMKKDLLTEAIKENDVEAAAAAIAAGADVNAQPFQRDSSYLLSAIEYGIYYKSDAIADLLLAAGADPNNGGNGKMLLPNLVIKTSSISYLRWIAKLIEAGADVNAREPDSDRGLLRGQTALTVSSAFAQVNVVKLLLRYGADPQSKDANGQTALDRAEKKLRQAKKDRLETGSSDTTAFLRESAAQEVVDLLGAVAEGRLAPATLPDIEQLIEEEVKRLAIQV
jgi:ankyrin repeat protein